MQPATPFTSDEQIALTAQLPLLVAHGSSCSAVSQVGANVSLVKHTRIGGCTLLQLEHPNKKPANDAAYQCSW